MEYGFFLKKWISFFIEPYGMILALFVIWFIMKEFKKESLSKLSLSLAFTLLFLFSYPPFANSLISNLETIHPKYNYSSKIKYIHVLGSGHNTDPLQPISSQIGGTGTKRDLEGIIIHLSTPDSKLIFTGYKGGSDVSTARMNGVLAEALGVKKENIILGESPKDTKEEALFAKTIVGDEEFVLVTSASHMPRAMRLFKSVGLNPIPAPTDFRKKDDLGIFELPSASSFYKSQRAMHEYWGILWSMIRG